MVRRRASVSNDLLGSMAGHGRLPPQLGHFGSPPTTLIMPKCEPHFLQVTLAITLVFGPPALAVNGPPQPGHEGVPPMDA